MENIRLFEVEEMKSGRSGGKKGSGEKYVKYKNAIAPHLGFLMTGIAAAKDGSIRVRVVDIAKAMGMPGKHETSMYWGLKYVLFAEGLVVTTGQTKDNEPVLIMREKKEGDVLPASLAKHIGGAVGSVEKAEEEEQETGSQETETETGSQETETQETGSQETETQDAEQE